MNSISIFLNEIAVPIGNLVVPILLAYIAYRQWSLDRQRVKYDYSKHYIDCYEKIIEGANLVLFSNKTPEQAYKCYCDAQAKARIYLDINTKNTIDKFVQDIIYLMGIEMELEQSTDRADISKKHAEAKTEIGKHPNIILELVRRYTV